MKKKELDKLKSMLLEKRAKIVQDLANLEEASEQEIALTGGDAADLASLEITQTALQKLGNREVKLLSKIDQILRKFDSGEYGICEMCGEEIGFRRLEARPEAQYCIDCKTELEQNERRYGEAESEDDEVWEGDSPEKFDESAG